MKKLKVLPSMHCDEGCGECCGLIPVTETEFRRVERYVKEHNITPLEQDGGTCPLYQGGKCTVYPVRPFICQVFGHAADPMLTCPRGYNVNVPAREVQRMVTANGMPVRTLHDLIPGFVEAAEKWGTREDAHAMLTGQPDVNARVQEEFSRIREEVMRGKR